ncbi:hypothetical protein R1flu_009993 [Riccia fluitans]|uniref:Uncharacterized protein n=1 Tax=Riccia fluitans TaxID=41844 RepID=A0ABD1Z431_9MARC
MRKRKVALYCIRLTDYRGRRGRSVCDSGPSPRPFLPGVSVVVTSSGGSFINACLRYVRMLGPGTKGNIPCNQQLVESPAAQWSATQTRSRAWRDWIVLEAGTDVQSPESCQGQALPVG